ncbi:UNVERIFIED_CONTAM: hypothetical protein K2H54_074944 [Gekko kuhli]
MRNETDYEGQAKKLLELMENTDIIIIAGGDGTMQEVITGLLRRADEAAFSKIPIGFIPLGKSSTLSHTLYPESVSQVQHIIDATLSILKGETIPVDVLQIKGNKDQPVFAVTGLRWGAYRDAGAKVSKYWYLGPLKTKAAHFFNTLKGYHALEASLEAMFGGDHGAEPLDALSNGYFVFFSWSNIQGWPQKHPASLIYLGPTPRPPEEPERKTGRPPLYIRLYKRLAQYWAPTVKETPREVTPEAWEDTQLSAIEFSITTQNRCLDLKRTEDFMNICIEPDTISKGEYIKRGSSDDARKHLGFQPPPFPSGGCVS